MHIFWPQSLNTFYFISGYYFLLINFYFTFLQVCLALRYLATGAAFSTIAETQQVSEATVSRVVNDLTLFFYYHAAE